MSWSKCRLFNYEFWADTFCCWRFWFLTPEHESLWVGSLCCSVLHLFFFFLQICPQLIKATLEKMNYYHFHKATAVDRFVGSARLWFDFGFPDFAAITKAVTACYSRIRVSSSPSSSSSLLKDNCSCWESLDCRDVPKSPGRSGLWDQSGLVNCQCWRFINTVLFEWSEMLDHVFQSITTISVLSEADCDQRPCQATLVSLSLPLSRRLTW